jgi:hypothetical protein
MKQEEMQEMSEGDARALVERVKLSLAKDRGWEGLRQAADEVDRYQTVHKKAAQTLYKGLKKQVLPVIAAARANSGAEVARVLYCAGLVGAVWRVFNAASSAADAPGRAFDLLVEAENRFVAQVVNALLCLRRKMRFSKAVPVSVIDRATLAVGGILQFASENNKPAPMLIDPDADPSVMTRHLRIVMRSLWDMYLSALLIKGWCLSLCNPRQPSHADCNRHYARRCPWAHREHLASLSSHGPRSVEKHAKSALDGRGAVRRGRSPRQKNPSRSR